MSPHLRTTRSAAVAALLGLTLSGCTAFAGTPTPPQSAEPIRLSESVISTPDMVDTPTGKYRAITVDPGCTAFAYDPKKFDLQQLKAQGYDEALAADGLHFATKYVVEQYLDSAALEGDRKAFDAWYKKEGALFVDQRVATTPEELAPVFVVLGNYGAQQNIPELVHDGKPRAKSVNLKLAEAGPYYAPDKLPGISYGLDFTADYRVSDKAAVAFLAARAGVSPAAFLTSGKVKPTMKDEIGENDFRVTGRVNVVIQPGTSSWHIVGFENAKVSGDFV
jgi:hypothetical protein